MKFKTPHFRKRQLFSAFLIVIIVLIEMTAYSHFRTTLPEQTFIYGFLSTIVFSLWFIMPAYLANAVPVFARGKTPLDAEIKFFFFKHRQF